MNLRVTINGDLVDLIPYTRELWHEMWGNYVRDKRISPEPYQYDQLMTERMYDIRRIDRSRKYFAIHNRKQGVGDIHLYEIDLDWKKACFRIELVNQKMGNKGYGSEAIDLLMGYAFNTLGLELLATIVRSDDDKFCHVLEKKGFFCFEERDGLRYYLRGKQ